MNTDRQALRPAFTAKIATLLSNAYSVNVFSSREKQGLRQLVEDLRTTCPQGTLFVTLNVQSYAHSLSALLMALCDNLGIANKPGDNLRILLQDYLKQYPEQKMWLCLLHFDRLAERYVDSQKVDVQGYNRDFLDHLNSFANNSRISLFFTSERELAVQELYVGGERVSGSKLDIPHRLALPDLDFNEIEAFLLSVSPEATASVLRQKRPFYTVLIPDIARQADPVEWMQYIADRIPPKADLSIAELEKKLRYWKKTFANQKKPDIDQQLGRLTGKTAHWSRMAKRLFGISSNVKKAYIYITLAVGLLGAIVVFWWEKIWNLFSFMH